jgi:hypothetical protein
LHQILGDLKPYQGEQWRAHMNQVGRRGGGREPGDIQGAPGDQPPGDGEDEDQEPGSG